MDGIEIDLDLDLDIDIDLGSDKIESQFIKIRHNILPISIKYSKAEKLVHDINIKKGESIFVNLNGDFVFGDFITAFIQENNLDVEELTIISLSGGLENFQQFSELIKKGWVKKLNLMLSGYFYRTEKKKHTHTIEYLEEIARENKNINIYYSNNHAKIVLIKTKQGGKVIFSGSANLRSSQSMEQLIIQENKELYDFQYKYFESMFNSSKYEKDY